VNDLRYPVPAAVHRIEQVVDRSRFICTVARAANAEEAQAFIKSMNTGFSNATHNTGGLVKAYGGAVQEALSQLQHITRGAIAPLQVPA
jgi:putative IMPACT (imprinted ancient) family translation regulator